MNSYPHSSPDRWNGGRRLPKGSCVLEPLFLDSDLEPERRRWGANIRRPARR